MSGMVESYERRARRRQPIDEWLRSFGAWLTRDRVCDFANDTHEPLPDEESQP